jgi:hypothetical protein
MRIRTQLRLVGAGVAGAVSVGVGIWACSTSNPLPDAPSAPPVGVGTNSDTALPMEQYSYGLETFHSRDC